MNSNDTLGGRLAQARAEKGLSQAELGDLAGIAPAQISRYESNRNVPRLGHISKLARSLAVSMHWLNTGADTPNGQSRTGLVLGEGEQATIVCLTFLRSARAALSSAIEARAPLSEEVRAELFEINRRVNSITTQVWDSLSTDE